MNFDEFCKNGLRGLATQQIFRIQYRCYITRFLCEKNRFTQGKYFLISDVDENTQYIGILGIGFDVFNAR